MFIESARGFLFIGDPHCSSKRIGRRKDDYLASVLEKLGVCAQLCHSLQLVPVILGDLLHRNDENNLPALTKLTRVLQRFPVPPVVLEGNHDKEQVELTDADALTLLSLGGSIVVASKCGLIGVYEFEGRPVRLWGCCYGQPLPTDLGRFEGQTILLTHHDLAFGSAYPGALPLNEVSGCQMAVNGHMHDTKKPVQAGATWWVNPGNIEPLSVDLASHVPCAWEWRPEFTPGELLAHRLPHGQDLFDLSGLQVEAASPEESVASVAGLASRFAAMLGQESEEAAKTDDASVMMADLAEVLNTSGVSEATKQLMQAVAANVVRATQGKEAAAVL